MVKTCWVKGCSNRADSSVKRSFFQIPKIRETEGEETKKLSEERRRVWLANVNRKDTPTKWSHICSDHFISGQPAALYDKLNPDWAPTQKLTDICTPAKSNKMMKLVESSVKRYHRVQERHETKKKHAAARALLELSEPEFIATPIFEEKPVCRFMRLGACTSEGIGNSDTIHKTSNKSVLNQSQVDSEIQRLLTENILLKQQLNGLKYNEDSFRGDPEKVRYYTGLPSFFTLMAVFEFVKPFIPKPRSNGELGQFERLILTFMRMKLNLPVQDLAFRFQTSSSTVSRTFLIVIHILYVRFKHMIYWPDRDELRKTMPIEFRKSFGQKTAVIIDCFEIFIQRPKNLMARAQTWSNYKHNNTVKFLIGITPQGSVSFLSKAWGGRASDKCITENCGLLQNLLPGDLILADRGFDIRDSVGVYCAQVAIPAFTKGKSQLSPIDVETTRKIAHVRIHVERVIGLVRNKYTMLQGRLPVDFLMSDDGLPVIDKVATVACALTNMCESVVPFN